MGSVSAASVPPRSKRPERSTTSRTPHEFRGTFGQARYGFALGTMSGGDLWLQEAGVIMRLKARREGLMLSLGGDAMIVSM